MSAGTRRNYLRPMMQLVLPVITVAASYIPAHAQSTTKKKAYRDPEYVTDYSKHLVLRAFGSSKFNTFDLIDGKNALYYRPNEHYTLGLGFNYRFLGLNLGFYFPFLGKDPKQYGKTTMLDLQTHVYTRKLVVDLYAQFYKGYYLSNAGERISNFPPGSVLLRPDMRTRDISLLVQHVFNNKKFSFNAPFYQNELQLKSAGSFLLGGGIFHSGSEADSSFLPSNMLDPNFFNGVNFDVSTHTAIGMNAGYAYTLVIDKHFFITAAVSGGPGISFATISNTFTRHTDSRIGLQLNLNERFAAGYSTDKFFAGVTFIQLITRNNSAEAGTWKEVNAGNFRIVAAKRILMKKRVKKK